MFQKSSYVLLTHALRVVLNKSLGISKCLHGMNGNSVAYTMQTFLRFYEWVSAMDSSSNFVFTNTKCKTIRIHPICWNPSTYSDVQFQSFLELFRGFSRKKYGYVHTINYNNQKSQRAPRPRTSAWNSYYKYFSRYNTVPSRSVKFIRQLW